jgi:hypothetical protein
MIHLVQSRIMLIAMTLLVLEGFQAKQSKAKVYKYHKIFPIHNHNTFLNKTLVSPYLENFVLSKD